MRDALNNGSLVPNDQPEPLQGVRPVTATPCRLFEKCRIRSVTLRNRVVVSPMAQYSAEDGAATDGHQAHFTKFALGGVRLVFTEAVKVERRGLGTVGDLGLWTEFQVAPLAAIAYLLERYGAVPGLQLNHAGRPWEGFGPTDRSKLIEGRTHWAEPDRAYRRLARATRPGNR
jgi:2,4-dienoyl-CoA reductase-like NADH-dependent reductase (Old Yellow Enzyme family)